MTAVAVGVCPWSYSAFAASSTTELVTTRVTDWIGIQQRLKALGFYLGAIDGQPGEQTLDAISAFQAANGLEPTGTFSTSGLRVLFSEIARRTQSTATAEIDGEFEILSDTDLPYSDYRSGKDDPRLKGISVEQCLAACTADQQCRAFTYNVKYEFCFLKEASPAPMPFKGAISGRRVAGGGDAPPVPTDGALTLVGAPEGCSAQESVVTRLRKGIDVSVDVQSATVGGAPVTLDWSRGEFPERLPVYLMISTGATPVRFSGKGFYALTPGARAAFDIRQFGGTTRAVVPLYGGGVPRDGTLTIEPLQEGNLKLQWDLVGMTECGEKAATPRILEVGVAAGAPEIIFQSPFSETHPIKRIASPAGDRSIDAFEGYYRLYDAAGLLLAERSGSYPRFSSTGRYISSWVHSYLNEVVDTIDGKVIYSDTTSAIGWDNSDSFIVTSAPAWGGVGLVSSLVGTSSMTSLGGGCHACTGLDDAMRIDLENNYFLLDYAAASLTTEAGSGGERGETDVQTAVAFAQSHSMVTAVRFPANEDDRFDWQLEGETPLSSIENDLRPGETPRNGYAMPFLIASIELPIDKPRVVAPNEETAVQAALRGPTRVTSATATNGTGEVLNALAPLIFAAPTVVRTEEVALDLVETREFDRVFKFPGAPQLRVVSSFAAGGCSVMDTDLKVDGTLYGYSLDTVRVQSTDRFTVVGTDCVEGSAANLESSILFYDKRRPSELIDLTPTFGKSAGYGLRVFDDRYFVFWSNDDESIGVYDGVERKMKAYPAIPRGMLIRDVSLDTTANWLVLHFPDNLFSILDLSDQRRTGQVKAGDAPIALEGMLIDGELIVWNDDLQFDSTAEGAEFVSVRFAGRHDVYALTQFEGALRHRGMLNNIPTSGAQQVRALSPPPVVDSSSVTASSDTLNISAAWPVGTVDKLTVLQDGLLTETISVTNKPDAQVSVPRMQGSKWVTLLAQDANGVVSRPYSTALGPDARGKRPTRLVAIGIDRYDDARLPTLPLARADAVNMETTFESLPLIELTKADRLTDEATKAASIRSALNAAVDASVTEETLVLSLSGHGVQDESGQLFLATRDTSLNDIAGTAISWTEIATIVSRAKGRVVIFLDTCHSGIAGTTYAAPSEGAVEDFLTAVPSNILIFSASKGRQSSQEQAALGGGVFTNALIAALGDELSDVDANGDGSLSISELYGHLRTTVMRDTKGDQTPWFARNKMVGDFAVF